MRYHLGYKGYQRGLSIECSSVESGKLATDQQGYRVRGDSGVLTWQHDSHRLGEIHSLAVLGQAYIGAQILQGQPLDNQPLPDPARMPIEGPS